MRALHKTEAGQGPYSHCDIKKDVRRLLRFALQPSVIDLLIPHLDGTSSLLVVFQPREACGIHYNSSPSFMKRDVDSCKALCADWWKFIHFYLKVGSDLAFDAACTELGGHACAQRVAHI